MTKVRQDIEMMPGDTRRFTIAVVDSAGQAIPTLSDSVAAVSWQIPAASITKTLSDGISITPGQSEIVIVLDPADTANIGPGEPFLYQCTVTDWSGNVSTLLWGIIRFSVSEPDNAPIELDGETDVFTAVLNGLDFQFQSNSQLVALL